MAHTANCIVKLELIRMIVIGRAIGRISSSGAPGGGPHSPWWAARELKYAANRPPKNITSLAMNSSMPSSGVGIPTERRSGSTWACGVIGRASALMTPPPRRPRRPRAGL